MFRNSVMLKLHFDKKGNVLEEGSREGKESPRRKGMFKGRKVGSWSRKERFKEEKGQGKEGAVQGRYGRIKG